MAKEIEKHDELTETEALLKILELGKRQVAEGNVHPAEEVIERLRKKHGFSDDGRNRTGDANGTRDVNGAADVNGSGDAKSP